MTPLRLNAPAAGLKTTLAVHDAPAFRTPTQALPGWKSVLFDVMEVIVNATVFRLVIVKDFCTEAPAATLPNASARGAITIGGLRPRPIRLAICGLFAALSEINTVASRTPSAVG